MITFGAPFAAMRKDPRWAKKVLLGGLINLIPYFGTFVVMGWALEYLRRVAWGLDQELPEWTGLGRHALRGLYGFAAIMPYSLALSLILTPVMVIVIAAVVIFATVAVGATAAAGSPPDPAAFVGSTVLATLVISFGSAILIMPFSYAITPLVYSAYARVALYDRLEAGFQFREIWDSVKKSRPTLLRAWGYTVLVGLLVQPLVLLSMAPYVGLLLLPAVAEGMPPQNVALAAAALLVAIPLTLLLVGLAGVFVSIATHHWWGVHARAAYGLADAPAA